MPSKQALHHARLAYTRLSQILDAQPTDFNTDESFEALYRIILVKLGVLEINKLNN